MPEIAASNFTWIDWSIVAAMLAVTTLLGHVLAGRQTNLRDFWLGGRKLPWYAVSGSIVATQLSGTTFIVLPMMVYVSDFRYIQLALFGQLIARFVVGFVILPQYYKRDIYSPYEYMAQKLGPGVRQMTTVLYTLTTVMTMGARIYTAAVLIELLLRGPLTSFEAVSGLRPIVSAMWMVGLVSMCWTLMGGICTVVWTDLVLFAFFFVGAVVALFAVWHHLPGGASEMVQVAGAANKFRLIDFDPSLVAKFTIWTGVIAATIDGIGGLGTNQTVTQRLLCCKNEVHARWALISSWLGITVPLTCMLVGAALYAFYQRYPLSAEAAGFIKADPNRLFPHFILTVLPTGLCGLIAAAIIAAAVASLESVQAALSQVTLSTFYLPWRQRRMSRPLADRSMILASRAFIVFWSVVLCLSALLVERVGVWRPDIAPTLIDLMGQLAGYIGGALLAGFLLAFLPLGVDGRGYLFSAPLSLLVVFAVAWHDTWAQWATAAGGAVLLACWLVHQFRGQDSRNWLKTLALLAGVIGAVAISRWGYFTSDARPGAKLVLAWPWYMVVGATVATLWGWLLAKRQTTLPPDELPEESTAGAVEPAGSLVRP